MSWPLGGCQAAGSPPGDPAGGEGAREPGTSRTAGLGRPGQRPDHRHVQPGGAPAGKGSAGLPGGGRSGRGGGGPAGSRDAGGHACGVSQALPASPSPALVPQAFRPLTLQGKSLTLGSSRGQWEAAGLAAGSGLGISPAAGPENPTPWALPQRGLGGGGVAGREPRPVPRGPRVLERGAPRPEASPTEGPARPARGPSTQLPRPPRASPTRLYP